MTEMSITGQIEEKQVKKNRDQGGLIVVCGGLAAIGLWISVLTTGSPIQTFESVQSSFLYAVLVSLPPIILGFVAIRKITKKS
jgi:hypothetical protein